jgi:hypothetical protein
MRRHIILTVALTTFPLFAQRAQAQEPAQEQAQEPEQPRKKEQLQVQESEQLVTPIPEPKIRAHGPEAPDGQFPSHVFRWRAHAPERVQLGFTYGLNQPILTHGFNAAIEVRYKRLVATYSHGQGLDYARFETSGERAAGAAVKLPWTTGGGVGVLLIDELWILAELPSTTMRTPTSRWGPSSAGAISSGRDSTSRWWRATGRTSIRRPAVA